MAMPSNLIKDMKDLHFTTKLCRIMKRLCDEDYDVEIFRDEISSIVDPLSGTSSFITICIRKNGLEPTYEIFRCIVPNYETISPLRTKENYDDLADNIYNKIFAKADDTKPRIFTVSKEEALFIKIFKEELASRGDFTVDIPKFVDVLFKLGVMIPKEDVETPESDEKIDVKEIPF